ncbi:zinc finger protein 862-like [Ostrea edulis]|uniref:zinc finger protein 862-like n=1 Tax=Ostrea edulis TaxID=37623 RepID=UPI0024AFF92C|nr:zinc finger protein 862-like [Ostrea edulis]
MFDGATDVSICKNEIVYARFVDNGVPKVLYVKIQDVEHAHAAGVLEAIEKSLDGIQEEWTWKEKLIATASDGANVNIGRKNSVVALLKNDVPHLLSMHGVCHRLELGTLDTMKARDAKIFADLKSVLLNLHKHYHYSPKALREVKALSEAMEQNMIKPVNLQGTRWMPHLSGCLDVLLRQYQVFVAHFENTVQGKIGTIDVQSRAKLILKHLKKYDLLSHMHFLKDMLAVLSELSLQFQKDACCLPDASEALETTCLQLVALQQRPGKSLHTFLDEVIHENNEYMLKGIRLSPPTLTAEQLKQKQNTLVDSVLNHINKRMGDMDTNHLLKDMQIFYPINLPATDAELAVYGEDQLEALCEFYSDVLNRLDYDVEHLKQTEWPALKIKMKREPNNTSIQDFYHRLFTNSNQKETLKNILVLVETVLCIPVSSAIWERGYSAMARIKSD